MICECLGFVGCCFRAYFLSVAVRVGKHLFTTKTEQAGDRAARFPVRETWLNVRGYYATLRDVNSFPSFFSVLIQT